MRVFEELRTRRSDPWSESGRRFGYIDFDTQVAYGRELALLDREEIKFQKGMDRALKETLKYDK